MFCILSFSMNTKAQVTNSQDKSAITNLSASEILDKTIKYYDPDGLWDTYKGKLFEVTLFPNNYVVKETIEIDKPNDFYLSTCFQDFGTLKRGINKGKNTFSLNDKLDIPEDIKTNWGISDDGIKMYREVHYGHFGLPMVVKKSGMTIQNEARITDFDGRKCFAVTFTGKPELIINPYYSGEWILYIDMNNFSMRGLKWMNGEQKGYAIFAGESKINGITLPLAICRFNNEGNHISTSINIPVSENNN